MMPGLNSANNSGAEDRHYHRRRRSRQSELRGHRSQGDLGPFDLNCQYDADIGEEHQSQPLKIADVAVIRDQHLKDQGSYREQQCEYVAAQPSTNSAAAPIAARSPPMLIVFAMNSSATRVVTAQAGKIRHMLPASPCPVTRPILALIICIDDISG